MPLTQPQKDALRDLWEATLAVDAAYRRQLAVLNSAYLAYTAIPDAVDYAELKSAFASDFSSAHDTITSSHADYLAARVALP